jgi:hypothetical protein
MIGRRDKDRCDAFIVEHMPKIGDRLRTLPACRFDDACCLCKTFGIDVANGGDFDILPRGQQMEMIRSHSARTDHANGNAVGVGGSCRRSCEPNGRSNSGLRDERATAGIHVSMLRALRIEVASSCHSRAANARSGRSPRTRPAPLSKFGADFVVGAERS